MTIGNDPTAPKPQAAPVMIADMQDADKPRERALGSGIRSLTDAELLAIILGSGTQGMSVIAMAHHLLRQAGSLKALSAMDPKRIARLIKGVGPAKAVSLAAAFELGARCRDKTDSAEMIVRSSEDAYRYIRSRLEKLDHEEFWVMCLSQKGAVTDMRCVSRGGMTATLVDVKVLMRSVLDAGATRIILAHNHPSGNMTPSTQDDQLTAKIKDAARLFDVPVLDHLIVGPDSFYSYNDHQRL